MSDPQIIWAALIAAQAVVATPFVLVLLKGTPMSDAFKAALAALVQKFTDKISAVQSALDAANAQVTDLQNRLSALDAEATSEVEAATPTA